MISEALGFRCPRWPLCEPPVALPEVSCSITGGFNACWHNSIVSDGKVHHFNPSFPQLWPSQGFIHWDFNVACFFRVLQWRHYVKKCSFFFLFGLCLRRPKCFCWIWSALWSSTSLLLEADDCVVAGWERASNDPVGIIVRTNAPEALIWIHPQRWRCLQQADIVHPNTELMH